MKSKGICQNIQNRAKDPVVQGAHQNPPSIMPTKCVLEFKQLKIERKLEFGCHARGFAQMPLSLWALPDCLYETGASYYFAIS